ncbi:MAG: hypothetical protein HY738_06605, partial [Bacteroidia bacterium]|nr:hypothetical protein [Bacteroidia bacterium]
DFILGKDDGRPHVSTNYRALVHDGYANQQDLLAINYAGDFADGVVIDGPKTYINGTLEVNNTVKLLALSGIQNPQFMLVSDGDGNLGTKQLNGFNPECITTDVNCNVGIGTETPGAKLHVYNGNIINGGADFILGKDDGRPHVSTNYRALVHDGYAKQQDLLAINYAGDFADGVVIDGPKTIINKQLDIKGGSGEPLQGQIHITGNGEYGGPGDAYISFYEGSEPGSVWSVGAKDVGNCFTISNSLSTDNNVKFVISEATGNVGINITNPNSKLEITDAGTSEPPQGQVHITGRNTTDKGDAFISFTDGTANCSYTNEWSVGANDALCGFTISNSKQIDNNVKFIIRGENVGIGTSWPNSDAKLHVYENAINKIAIVAGDTTANSIWLVPKIGCCGSFNTISKEGDVGIIFRNGDQNQGTPPAGLVLAPHNTTDYIARGIRIDPNGNVGIGVKDPQSRLHIKDGHGCLTLETSASTEDGYSDITFKDEYYGSNDATNRTWVIRAKNHAGILQNPANSLEFWSIKGGQMQIIGGNVLIGSVTHNDVHNLYVNGNIWAKEVRVKSTNPYVDYVFKEDYKLMNLYILEKFIRENRHLPEIPTEADVPKDGIDLEQMNILLLKKVEELTLYTIEQQKMIDVMKSEIEILKSK